VGNRLTSAATAEEWGYDANNQLSGYDGVTFAYDANGNTTQRVAGGVATR